MSSRHFVSKTFPAIKAASKQFSSSTRSILPSASRSVLDNFLDNLHKMDNSLMSPFYMSPGFQPVSTGSSPSLVLPLDFYEEKNIYHVVADIPGVKKTDLKVTVDKDHILTIEAIKVSEDCSVVEEDGSMKSDRTYHRMERQLVGRRCVRSMRLPQDSTPESTTASHSNGVLHIHVPKHTISNKEIEESTKLVEID